MPYQFVQDKFVKEFVTVSSLIIIWYSLLHYHHCSTKKKIKEMNLHKHLRIIVKRIDAN